MQRLMDLIFPFHSKHRNSSEARMKGRHEQGGRLVERDSLDHVLHAHDYPLDLDGDFGPKIPRFSSFRRHCARLSPSAATTFRSNSFSSASFSPFPFLPTHPISGTQVDTSLTLRGNNFSRQHMIRLAQPRSQRTGKRKSREAGARLVARKSYEMRVFQIRGATWPPE